MTRIGDRRGGARPGAGRKPGPATRISVPGRVSERAQQIARTIGGDALTGLLEEYAIRNRLDLPEHEPIGVVTCPQCQGDARGPACLCRGTGNGCGSCPAWPVLRLARAGRENNRHGAQNKPLTP